MGAKLYTEKIAGCKKAPIKGRCCVGVDLNHRPLGYEPNELPDCSTSQCKYSKLFQIKTPSIKIQGVTK